LAETQEEVKPYRYFKTFKEGSKENPIDEMASEELQAHINQILGAKNREPAPRIISPN